MNGSSASAASRAALGAAHSALSFVLRLALPGLIYINQGPAPKRMEKPPDPSKVTRVELAAHMAESVSSIGALAKFVGKAASSPALHSTVTAFAEYEGLIESTDRMLQKINQGLLDVEEVLDETSQAIVPAVSSDGLYAAAQPQQPG